MSEHWRDVPGYEGLYQVSDQGQIKSTRRKGAQGKILKCRILIKPPNMPSYYYVSLSKGDKGVKFYIHRLVAAAFLSLSTGDQVDHINRDTFDNQLSNLRICTASQNHHNSKRSVRSRSPYKGIWFDKRTGKWAAEIRVNHKKIWLGRHDTPEDAHAAYCEAAKRYAYEFARFE